MKHSKNIVKNVHSHIFSFKQCLVFSCPACVWTAQKLTMIFPDKTLGTPPSLKNQQNSLMLNFNCQPLKRVPAVLCLGAFRAHERTPPPQNQQNSLIKDFYSQHLKRVYRYWLFCFCGPLRTQGETSWPCHSVTQWVPEIPFVNTPTEWPLRLMTWSEWSEWWEDRSWPKNIMTKTNTNTKTDTI